VRGACEILGFDPDYVANEGRFVVLVPERDADRALDALRSREVSTGGSNWIRARGSSGSGHAAKLH